MSFFFFTDPATTEIYTLSLHDALPISSGVFKRPSKRASSSCALGAAPPNSPECRSDFAVRTVISARSEEHTSELQSHSDLVCRLLLEKKKNKKKQRITTKIT